MILKRFVFILLIQFILVVSIQAFEFKPGLYEITSKMEMPGMPVDMPSQTFTYCMTEQNFVPPSNNAQNQNCKIKNIKKQGNTIFWTMECIQEGQTMISEGEMTFKGDMFEGKSIMKMGPQADNMTMTAIMTGKRLSDCQKEE
jgi:hypothetical protein